MKRHRTLAAPLAALALLAGCSTGGSTPAPLIVPAAIEGTSAETRWRELAARERDLIEQAEERRDEVADAQKDLDRARDRLESARDDLREARRVYAGYENAPPPQGSPETIAAEQRRRADAAEDVSDAQTELAERSRRVDSAENQLREARDELADVERELARIGEERRRLETR